MSMKPHLRRLLLLTLAVLVLASGLAGCARTPEDEYLRGIEASARGDWDAAERHLERAGDTGDAQERLAKIQGKLNSLRRDYDAAYAAMRKRRWFDAFESLNRVAALEPDFRDTQKRLTKVRRKLDETLADAEALVAKGELDDAAALLERAGEFKGAQTRQAEVAALASQCAGYYAEMQDAAYSSDWVRALESGSLLLQKSPNYRDAARRQEHNLRDAYAAATEMMEARTYGQAAQVLSAIEAAQPYYEHTHTLLPTASANAVHDLMGIHPYRKQLGEHLGCALHINEIEVRPEGELIVRVTIKNASSLRNRIDCPQNDADEAAYYFVSAAGDQVSPTDCSCRHGKIDEYLLGPGESFDAWWQYPAQANPMAAFDLAFGPWGVVSGVQLSLR